MIDLNDSPLNRLEWAIKIVFEGCVLWIFRIKFNGGEKNIWEEFKRVKKLFGLTMIQQFLLFIIGVTSFFRSSIGDFFIA